MLVTLNEVLRPAQKQGYAVGLFNTVNLEMARGVLAAAETLRSPVIIGTAEVLLPFAPLEELSDFLVPMAKRASVPVVVHFDHGLTFETCMEALKLGFSSVMYDCSTDSYEENVRKVAELTRIAHALGASVEAELGHVGDGEDSAEKTGDSITEDLSKFYTKPEEALDFVSRTGIDALAVAVGTVHGTYRFTPRLDLERIRTIAELTGLPLVLHGGSGLSEADFKAAISRGICKVNIFTDINAAQAEAARTALESGKKYATDLTPAMVEAVRAEAMKKMRMFGSANRA